MGRLVYRVNIESRLRSVIGIRGKMIHFGEGKGPESGRDQTKAGERQ